MKCQRELCRFFVTARVRVREVIFSQVSVCSTRWGRGGYLPLQVSGYLPWLGWGTYLGQRGTYFSWGEGVHTLAGGGYLHWLRWGTYLDQGYPPWPGGTYLGWGVPHFGQGCTTLAGVEYPPPRDLLQEGGGMPLAFTQEDFLVLVIFSPRMSFLGI